MEEKNINKINLIIEEPDIDVSEDMEKKPQDFDPKKIAKEINKDVDCDQD